LSCRLRVCIERTTERRACELQGTHEH
jgi:hypothetical protein